MPQVNATQPIDLEKWLIEPAEAHRSNGVAEQEPMGMTGSETEPTSDESEPTCTSPCLPIAHQVSAAMFQTQTPDYRTPAIQIGFNFVERESI
jgi:hypothetical protein